MGEQSKSCKQLCADVDDRRHVSDVTQFLICAEILRDLMRVSAGVFHRLHMTLQTALTFTVDGVIKALDGLAPNILKNEKKMID